MSTDGVPSPDGGSGQILKKTKAIPAPKIALNKHSTLQSKTSSNDISLVLEKYRIRTSENNNADQKPRQIGQENGLDLIFLKGVALTMAIMPKINKTNSSKNKNSNMVPSIKQFSRHI